MPGPNTLTFNGYTIDFLANGEIDLYWVTGASLTMNTDTIWAAFKISTTFTNSVYNTTTYNSETSFTSVYGRNGGGGAAEIITKSSAGEIFSYGSNDTLNLFAVGSNDEEQHIYSGGGDDTLNFNFSSITAASTAHSWGQHTRADDGFDTFNFTGLSGLTTGKVVVGRIEDFDASLDRIQVNGVTLDLSVVNANARIVLSNGDHNDPGAPLSQWLVISSSAGGYAVYALEGARVDMVGTNGGSNLGEQEVHFISSSAAQSIIALSNQQPNVLYVNPQNYIPSGFTAQGGSTLEDTDVGVADVTAVFSGSANGDLMAAGLNNDTVDGGAGNDRIWGGSGDDSVRGGTGEDTLNGGTSNDVLDGGAGNDSLLGDTGNDTLIYSIGGGADTFDGGTGVDTLQFTGTGNVTISLATTNVQVEMGLKVIGIENTTGSSGNDSLTGNAGSNILIGNDGNDALSGYGGNDSLVGGNGGDFLWGLAGSDTLNGGAGNDLIEGGNDIDLMTGGTGNDNFRFHNASQGGDTITDWGNNDDTFLLSVSGFGGGLAVGALNSGQFILRSGSGNNAGLDGNDRVIFNTATKTVWFDVDGVGGAGPVLLATLQAGVANLSSSDFTLF